VKIRIVLCFLLFFQLGVFGQSSFFSTPDSLNKKRFWTTNAAVGVGYAGSLIGLKSVWYKEPWQNFHFFNDGKSWMQMDKAGHFYACYAINRAVSDWYSWTGLKREKADLMGLGISFSYLAFLEVFDGFSQEWGFSGYDFLANTTGVMAYWTQQHFWQKQRIQAKISYQFTPYAKYRPEVLGANVLERMLKDYNGHTFWLSASPGNFGVDKFPKWLCFSMGYSVDQKLVGDEDIYLNYMARRQWIFSMDIDLTEIPVKKPFWKAVFKQMNLIKIPFPAVVFTKYGNRFSPLYF